MTNMKQTAIIILLILSTLTSFANKERWDDNKQDWSELMIAIYNGQTSKYLKLIEQGINVNFITPGTSSNWRLTALDVAIRKDNGNAVKALLETHKIEHPEKFLMTASGQNSSLTIDLLIKFGANPNDTLENGYSVLMMAASFGSFEVLECLLKHGANVKQTRRVDGITALMLAAFNGQPQKVRLLLDYKADKTIKDKNGETALNYVDNIYPYLKISDKTKTELKSILK
jgi:ankyrin repeat protein